MAEQTIISIEWEARPAITLSVRRSRAFSADELRAVADVVECIETLREFVQENETVPL